MGDARKSHQRSFALWRPSAAWMRGGAVVALAPAQLAGVSGMKLRDAAFAQNDTREISLLWRLVRYGGVGASLAGCYSAIVLLGMKVFSSANPILVAACAFLITLLPSYVAHSCVSFNDRKSNSAQPLRFTITYSMSLFIAVVDMYFITEIAGGDYRLSVALNWLLAPLANFTVYMTWVFRPPNREMN